MEEVWKDIKGYEGIYQVSDKGNVRRIVNNNKLRYLKPRGCGSGYKQVSLCVNSCAKSVMIHRLVAINFVPNPENKREVNHINGIKTDNRVENLEWCTPSENHIHAVNIGLHVSGAMDKRHKKVLCFDLKGNLISEYNGSREASRETGVCQSSISGCCLGKIKKTKNLIFKYKS